MTTKVHALALNKTLETVICNAAWNIRADLNTVTFIGRDKSRLIIGEPKTGNTIMCKQTADGVKVHSVSNNVCIVKRTIKGVTLS